MIKAEATTKEQEITERWTAYLSEDIEARMVKFWVICGRPSGGRLNRSNLTTNRERHEHQTRNPDNFVSLKCNTEQRRRAFLNTVSLDWNLLPADIK